MPQQWRHGKTIGHSGWTKGMYDRFGWICVGPLSDGEDKNRTFLSWLVRATWMSGADGTP
jgi:hypothetical protein